MEITKYSKLDEHHVRVMKDISSLVGSAVLSAFPHMPKNLFSYARYEFHFRGDSRSINVHFDSRTRCTPISIRLPRTLKGESIIVADNKESYLRLDSATLVRDVTRLSNGFWSSTLNSSAPFVGLRFDSDATMLFIYHQKVSQTPQGVEEYFNFEEVLSDVE